MGNQPGINGTNPQNYHSSHHYYQQSQSQSQSITQTNQSPSYSSSYNTSKNISHHQYRHHEQQQKYAQKIHGTGTHTQQLERNSGSAAKKVPAFSSKVEEIDKIKVGIKLTRDKVDRLIDQYQCQIASITQQLGKQKENGLSNKKKAVFLLKQRKQFEKQMDNLMTRKNVVMKTLNDLNQQHLDKEMVAILEQSNKYMKNVQDELQKMDWRGVLADVAANKALQNDFILEAEQDPDVERMYQQMEREVLGDKYVPSRVQTSIPSKIQVNIPSAVTVQEAPDFQKHEIQQNNQQKEVYLMTNQPNNIASEKRIKQQNTSKANTLIQTVKVQKQMKVQEMQKEIIPQRKQQPVATLEGTQQTAKQKIQQQPYRQMTHHHQKILTPQIHHATQQPIQNKQVVAGSHKSNSEHQNNLIYQHHLQQQKQLQLQQLQQAQYQNYIANNIQNQQQQNIASNQNLQQLQKNTQNKQIVPQQSVTNNPLQKVQSPKLVPNQPIYQKQLIPPQSTQFKVQFPVYNKMAGNQSIQQVSQQQYYQPQPQPQTQPQTQTQTQNQQSR